jgi:hypothetical protein
MELIDKNTLLLQQKEFDPRSVLMLKRWCCHGQRQSKMWHSDFLLPDKIVVRAEFLVCLLPVMDVEWQLPSMNFTNQFAQPLFHESYFKLKKLEIFTRYEIRHF